MSTKQSFARSMNQSYKTILTSGLVDLGSWCIHIIHNAFGKGLEKYGKEIDQLCFDLHSFFKYSAAR